MQIKQAVDEFLNNERSMDDCVTIWEQLADEVQNGDQDVAIEQARRVVTLTKALVSVNGNDTVLDSVRAFIPALVERGMMEGGNAD